MINPLKFMECLYFKGYSMSQALRLWRAYKLDYEHKQSTDGNDKI